MILLISATPVAGTITRLANWIGAFSGRKTVPVVMRNYPHNAFALPDGALRAMPEWEKNLAAMVRSASAIFLHNYHVDNKTDASFVDLIFAERSSGCPVFFQCHSPALEPPAYLYSVLDLYTFDKVFVVGQGHGRFFSDAVTVPNIVPDQKNTYNVEKSDIVFVPHLRSAEWRWSRKVLESDLNVLKANAARFGKLKVQTINQAFGRDHVTAGEIAQYLFAVKLIVDDMNTGQIHQTTVEGIKAGCVVMSGADLWAMEEYCETVNCPPLPVISVGGIDDVVANLSSPGLNARIRDIRAKSDAFATTYLGEARLAAEYWKRVAPFLA